MRFIKMCLLLVATLLTTSSVARADFFGSDQCCDWDCGPCKPYVRLGTGISFPQKIRIHANPIQWDPAVQGYNSKLKGRPIFGVGLGYDFGCLFSADLTLSYRPSYQYRKFQNSPASATSAGFLGASKTRHFNLDMTSLMLTGYLNGGAWDFLRWDVGCNGGYLQPVLGFGVGATQVRIRDFRTTGIGFTNPDDPITPGFASSNCLTHRYKLSYTLSIGLEYKTCDWAVSTGYRWFSVNSFKGPSFTRDARGFGGDLRGFEWKNRFRANEWFLDFKLYF